MATMLSEPSHSIALLQPSMADTLPTLNTLNLGFDDLRTRMSLFTARFDDFIERGRQRVLDERNQFRLQVAQAQEEKSTTLRTLHTLQSQTTQHTAALSQQAAETREMQTSIASLTSTRDARAAHLSALQSRLAAARATIASRKAAQWRYAEQLAEQGGLNEVELAFWEKGLGLRVEGTGREDRIRFVFLGCGRGGGAGRRKGGREASFELDMSRGYEVVECRPALEVERVKKVMERMSEGEDLKGFLAGMRRLFGEEFGR